MSTGVSRAARTSLPCGAPMAVTPRAPRAWNVAPGPALRRLRAGVGPRLRRTNLDVESRDIGPVGPAPGDAPQPGAGNRTRHRHRGRPRSARVGRTAGGLDRLTGAAMGAT